MVDPEKPRDPHDQAFFEQMRACRGNYRKLADCIHQVVGKQESCLDIGCGIGLQTARLIELGWTETKGAEFSPHAIEMIEPGVEVMPFDLTAASNNNDLRVYDCVICTETAEHIPAEHADAIVRNVASRATEVIVWSAAQPGQEWEGHINLQPSWYWIQRFTKLGWAIDIARTGALRDAMCSTRAQHWGAAGNFFVFVQEHKYRPLRITVTSTALNAQAHIARCVDSVQRQSYPFWKHVVVDAASHDATARLVREASERDPRTQLRINAARKSALQNAWDIWMELPDDEIIAWLDGDDYLAGDHALDVVARAYASPSRPWLTYGQFMQPSGEISAADAYPPGADFRWDRWRATHLKTFRAGLVKKIRPEDLLNAQGQWCDLSIDRVIMYPLLEMAQERAMFIPNVLYVYNVDASWWMTQNEDERAREQREVVRIQSMPRYERLANRPW